MIDQAVVDAFWRSWIEDEGRESYEDIHAWIVDRNNATPVSVQRIGLDACDPWHYDEGLGCIRNANGSFFQVAGLRKIRRDISSGKAEVVESQPVFLQDEIGYLGILCKEFDGVMHFLMQAKIEPGNINKVQISPSVQATRSNFMQLHGGRRPAYLDFFLHSEDHYVIVDQIQSEQSSRFLGKRNRNVILFIKDDIAVLPTHKWMTLGQMKKLMLQDNLVNMDTRTVLSCIPWSLWCAPSFAPDKGIDEQLIASVFAPFDMDSVNDVYRFLNNFKMFDTLESQLAPLFDLQDWDMREREFVHREIFPFKVIFCEITIDGREVKRWKQPLFEATGEASFGLLVRRDGDASRFLIRGKPEIGCFDKIELAPTYQREAGSAQLEDVVEKTFMNLIAQGGRITHNVLLSEEGGRFYCEQNRNLIVEVDDCPSCLQDGELPEGYFWLDFATLNLLARANNVLNIQLRNLISLLDVRDR